MHLGAFSVSLAVKNLAASQRFYAHFGFTPYAETSPTTGSSSRTATTSSAVRPVSGTQSFGSTTSADGDVALITGAAALADMSLYFEQTIDAQGNGGIELHDGHGVDRALERGIKLRSWITEPEVAGKSVCEAVTAGPTLMTVAGPGLAASALATTSEPPVVNCSSRACSRRTPSPSTPAGTRTPAPE